MKAKEMSQGERERESMRNVKILKVKRKVSLFWEATGQYGQLRQSKKNDKAWEV